MPTLQIDGMTVQVPEGASLLAAARAAGARVPTLCHHEAVEAWGGCRLCVVDVTRAGSKGAPRMVTACLFPAEDGLVVQTSTPRVEATRRVVMDLLLARCPETPLVRELARAHGIEATSYEIAAEPTDCVLCGLCTRVCEKIGVAAIASVSRGTARVIGTPFDAPPPDCIGCLACAEVCPTHHIRASQSGTTRKIWGRAFEMQCCERCGASVVTLAQVEWAKARGLAERDYRVCDACKRADLARTFATLRDGDARTAAPALVE